MRGALKLPVLQAKTGKWLEKGFSASSPGAFGLSPLKAKAPEFRDPYRNFVKYVIFSRQYS
jgi:hypothetical protein